MDPDNVAVLLMRASVYQEKGDKDKALADVDQALKLKPELPLAIRTRAVLLADSQAIRRGRRRVGEAPQARSERYADAAAIGHALQRAEEDRQGDRDLHGAAGRGSRGLAGPARTRRRLLEHRQAGRGHRRLRKGLEAPAQGRGHPQQPRLGPGHLARRQAPQRQAGRSSWPPRPAS